VKGTLVRTKQVRDPKGTILHATLLRVLERDERGRPTMTRLCHDDETLGLVSSSEGRNEFIVVWAPAGLTMYPKGQPGPVAPPVPSSAAEQLAELRKVNDELVESARRSSTLQERLRIAKWLNELAEDSPWPVGEGDALKREVAGVLAVALLELVKDGEPKL
jgi:hypothetical protein